MFYDVGYQTPRLIQDFKEFFVLLVFHGEIVLPGREGFSGDFLNILLETLEDNFSGLAKNFGHARHELGAKAKHIVVDQQLAVRGGIAMKQVSLIWEYLN